MIESPAYNIIKEDARLDGIKEGEHKKQLKIAQNMLSENMDLETVVRLTGLTEIQLREAGLIK